MEYLLLWSGIVRGMRKARIPAISSRGITGHLAKGQLVTPCKDSIRAALPFRFRAAFDRDSSVWFDKHKPDYPCRIHLTNRRGKAMVTLYLQPLNEVVK